MRQCYYCHKGSIMVATRKLLRGHYNPVNWTRSQPNLQKMSLPTGGKPFGAVQGKPFRTTQGKRVLVCTKCMRTMSKSPIANSKSSATKR